MTEHYLTMIKKCHRPIRYLPFLWLLWFLETPSFGQDEKPGSIAFRNVTSESGFRSSPDLGGHGIQVADVNGDGWLDVYVTHIFDSKQNRPDLLFRNLGQDPTQFEEVGVQAGVQDDGFFMIVNEDETTEEVSEESHAAVFADLDNDGDMDLFNGHTWSGNHRLYRNDGSGQFVDITESAGIDVRDLGPRGIGAADLDSNGFVDIIVTAWEGYLPNVYMNLGGLRFERRRLQGNANPDFANQGLSIVDTNGDGRPDISLTAFEYVQLGGVGPISILRNEFPRFVDQTEFAGLNYEKTIGDFRGTNGWSFQDVDNDGDLDLVIVGFHGAKLYLSNKSEGRYNFAQRFEGIHYTAAFGDVDNDGDLDLYLAGEGRLFENDGKGGFSPTSSEVGLNGIGADARSAVFADMNNDGWLDLLVASKQGANTFFLNEGGGAGWLKVLLIAPNGEVGAIGAQLSLYRAGQLDEPAGLIGYRVVQASTGYCSQDPAVQHFGVDPESTFDLRVDFSDGSSRTVNGIEPSQVLAIGRE